MNFKSKKRKGTHHTQGNAHKTVNRILSRNPARKEWDDIVKPLKEKMPTKNTTSSDYLSKMKERKDFPDEQGMKEFITTKTAF